MTRTSRCSAARAALTGDGSAKPGGTAVRCAPRRLTLDELLAEPMVQQLMRRDRTDEAAVRRLWENMAATRPAQTPCQMPPLSMVRDELGHLLREIARLWRGRCERVVRARLPGMTWARCAVLFQLAQPQGRNQASLAHGLDITPMRLVGLLDQLEAAGLVSRLPDPDDRRAYLLTPTAKAQPLIACIRDIIRMIESEARRGLTDTETNQLHVLLCRIRSNLSAGTNGPLPAEPARDSEHG
jgi:MarR family transcriptional regulator, transcriptional regulator for hemolysin